MKLSAVRSPISSPARLPSICAMISPFASCAPSTANEVIFGSAPASLNTRSSRTAPHKIIRGSLTVILARPCCPDLTVAAVVRSPWPRSSSNARLTIASRSSCWKISIYLAPAPSCSICCSSCFAFEDSRSTKRCCVFYARLRIGFGHEILIVQSFLVLLCMLADLIEFLFELAASPSRNRTPAEVSIARSHHGNGTESWPLAELRGSSRNLS